MPAGSTEVHQVTGKITLEVVTVFHLSVPPTATFFFFLNELQSRLTKEPEPSAKHCLCDG